MKLSLIFLIVGSVYIQIVRKDYTTSFRNKITFICLFFLPASLALMNFNKVLPIMASLNSIFVLLNCLCIVLLLSLFRSKILSSQPHKRIVYFWLYMLVCSVWSENWLPVFSGKLGACLIFIGGVALGYQIMQQKKLHATFNILTTIGILVICVIYLFALPKLADHSFIEHTGWVRLGGRNLINPNTISMVLLPFALAGLIRVYISYKKIGSERNRLLWLWAGSILVFFSVWLMIRTGSRSGFLSLCVSTIIILSFIARNKRSRIILSLLFTIIITLVVLDNSTGLRVLSVVSGAGTDFTSGRIQEWGTGVSSMTAAQIVFGTGGTAFINVDELSWARYLSIYITIYEVAGIVGCFLFASFILSIVQQVQHTGQSAMPAACFIAAALVYGVGEAGPISPFNIQCLFFGFGVGLLPLGKNITPKRPANQYSYWSTSKRTLEKF